MLALSLRKVVIKIQIISVLQLRIKISKFKKIFDFFMNFNTFFII